MNETLFSIPSVVASLLKHKRHEWIVIAFEKNKKIEKIWLNKGCNESTVSLRYNIEHFIETEENEGYTAFLIFHNHPNSNPYKYSMNMPSEIDLKTAESRGKILINKNINLFEFVCEREKYYPFFQTFCEDFIPLGPIFTKIEQKNGKSTMDNLSLHFQRVFG